MKKVRLSNLFFKHLARFSKKEQEIIRSKLKFLEANPGHNSLRTKNLNGTYKNWRESSISMGIRLIWRFNKDETVIIVEDVGRHDIMKIYG
jgi:mRNA-degrading endonuclease YafQ of YafQ-DinJ toxin-antitoxin module